jgi:exosortase
LKLDSIENPRRWPFFGIWVALVLLVFSRPLYGVYQLALRDDTYSYLFLIPPIFAWLLYLERKHPEPAGSLAFWPAITIAAAAVSFAVFSLQCRSCPRTSVLALYSCSVVLLSIAGFVLIFGRTKARASFFSLAFLFFAVPIPDFLLQRIIYWLQSGSARIAEVLFEISGAPVLREGFVFRLPKMSIEVARECSGIRSSMALLILALLVAHFAFRPIWKKLTFVFAGLCMMLIKNGIRIASLTLLANYVSPSFLLGPLHHQGGIVFFLIGLGLLIPVFRALRKGETSNLKAAEE